MLRLTTTLVAMTAAKPWRAGWSAERGVDFAPSAAPAPRVPAGANRPVPAEPSSFVDPDERAPSAGGRGRTPGDGAAAGSAVEPVESGAPFRAWSRLPAGSSGA
ncbi:MAG: hypothetical protein Q8R45_07025 [Brevundimonas sp.]|uniref:hypothetical protein n=1 Tax=Brevundimonas sp. TaxID=1871086 RepID=UPI0027363552|nr:hypothetical protein [Brevundimonas sp.]MDP3656698.1 hypothetical protein [Brevundimonas sp.]